MDLQDPGAALLLLDRSYSVIYGYSFSLLAAPSYIVGWPWLLIGQKGKGEVRDSPEECSYLM